MQRILTRNIKNKKKQDNRSYIKSIIVMNAIRIKIMKMDKEIR